MTQVPIPTARPEITSISGTALSTITINWDHARYATLPATELYQRGFWRFEMTPMGGSTEHRTTPWHQWDADAVWQDSVTIGARAGEFPLTAGTAISIRMYFEPTDDTFTVIPAYRTPIYSNTVTFTPTATQTTTNYRTLETPVVTAVVGNQSVDVQWSWAGDNANVDYWEVNYLIGSAPVTVRVDNAAARERGFTGLVNGREYRFRVRAVANAGWNSSAWSAYVSARPVAPIQLAGPTSFSVTGGVRSFEADWDFAGSTGRTAWRLEWQAPGEEWEHFTTNAAAIEFARDNLDEAGIYNFRIRAVGDGRRYLDSDWTTTTATIGDFPPVGEARNLRTSTGRLSITLSWRRPKINTGVSGYKIRYLTGGGSLKTITVTSTGALDYSQTFSNLQPGSWYFTLQVLGDGTTRTDGGIQNIPSVLLENIYATPLRDWKIYCLFNAGGRTQSQMRNLTPTTSGVVDITEHIAGFSYTEGHESSFATFRGILELDRNKHKFTVGAEDAYDFESRMNILGMIGTHKLFSCWGFIDGDTINLDSGSDFLRSLDVNHPQLAPLAQPTRGTFANLVWQANSFSAATAAEVGSASSEYDHIMYDYPEGTTVLDALKVVTHSRGGYCYQDGFGRIQSRNWIQVNEAESVHDERHIGVIGEVTSRIHSHYGPHYNFIEFGGETFLNNDSIAAWGTSKLKLKSYFADPSDALSLLYFAGDPQHHYEVRLPFAGPATLARYVRIEGDFPFGSVNAAYHVVSRTVKSHGPTVRVDMTLMPEGAEEDEFIIGQARIGTSEIL